MSNSESLLDNLLNNSQTNYLKAKCPSLFDQSGSPNFSYNDILSTDKTVIIPDGLKYYQVVESGNNYVSDLLQEEEKFLKEKYGESLYKYFVTKREKYIDEKLKDVCSSKFSTSGDSEGVVNNSKTILVDALNKQLRSFRSTLHIFNEVSNKKKQMVQNDSLNARTFYYRSIAIAETDYIDKLITTLYYFIVVLCIFYLLLKQSLQLNKKWWLYVLIILLPLFISRIYRTCVYVYDYIMIAGAEQLPKKSFLNQE